MPIQFRAACEPVKTEALLNEGSSGEYEASARNRRRAETPHRNPTSSFNRRFLVGSKIFERNVMWHRRQTRELLPSRGAAARPEPHYYGKKLRPTQCGKKYRVANKVQSEN